MSSSRNSSRRSSGSASGSGKSSSGGVTVTPEDIEIADAAAGIDATLLEKRLENLRDTQESVQGLSIWCQAYKKHSTAIIDTWLRVLRKSPVEKRLTMFYLANDIVQHAKRKGDATVVNQWAVAVQKATPHVRTPSSISNAISRIFKIWEERAIYSKDAVADLLSLLSKHNATGKEKGDKPMRKPETYTAPATKVNAFQPSTLIAKAKQTFRLKSHLGVTFRTKQYVNQNMEQLIASIKDRQHGMEVVEVISSYIEQLTGSEAKLLNEVEERRKIVETTEIGIVYYENFRSEAAIVNTAYKSFTNRVLSTKEKVDEKMRAFDEMERMSSPPPSPSPPNNNSYISRDVLKTLDMGSLSSIKLPKASPHQGQVDRPPPEDMPWTNTHHAHTHTHAQAIKSLVSSNSAAAVESGGYSSTSTMSGMSDSTLQQLAEAQLAGSGPPDMQQQQNWSGWTNDSYQQQMASLQQQQYPATPPVPAVIPAKQNFTLTPSMQLQMQLQQAYATGGGGGVGGFPPTADVSSIPLPPGPNPPLPLPPGGENQMQMQMQVPMPMQNHGYQSTTYENTSAQAHAHAHAQTQAHPQFQAQDWGQHKSANANVVNANANVNAGTTFEQYDPQGHAPMTPTQYSPPNQQRYHPYNQSPVKSGWQGQMHQPPVVRSPNPGYSPRNPRMTTTPSPQRGYSGGTGTPNSSFNSGHAHSTPGDKNLGLTGLDTTSAMSPPPSAISPDYGYNSTYNDLGSSGSGSGMNGNEDNSYSNEYPTPPYENKQSQSKFNAGHPPGIKMSGNANFVPLGVNPRLPRGGAVRGGGGGIGGFRGSSGGGARGFSSPGRGGGFRGGRGMRRGGNRGGF